MQFTVSLTGPQGPATPFQRSATIDWTLGARPQESATGRLATRCRHWCFAGLGPQSSGQRTLAMAMSYVYRPPEFLCLEDMLMADKGSTHAETLPPAPLGERAERPRQNRSP